jgi:hypothetical protein
MLSCLGVVSCRLYVGICVVLCCVVLCCVVLCCVVLCCVVCFSSPLFCVVVVVGGSVCRVVTVESYFFSLSCCLVE